MKSLAKLIRVGEIPAAPNAWRPVDLNGLPGGAELAAPTGGRSQGSVNLSEFGSFYTPVTEAQAAAVKETAAFNGNGFHPPENGSQPGPVSGQPPVENLPAAYPSQENGAVKAWLPEELNGKIQGEGLSYDPADLKAFQEKAFRELRMRAEKQAQEQAMEIQRSARQQADEIIRQAQGAAAKISEQARQEGVAAAHAQVTGLLKTADSLVAEVGRWQETMLSKSEPMVLNLIHLMAHKIFGSGMTLSPEILKDNFERALAEAKTLGRLRVSAHPEDVSALGALWPEEQRSMTGQHIELVPNKEILRGGCYIDGDFGTVDARVDTQIKLVTGKLASTFEESRQPLTPFVSYEPVLGD